MHKKWSEKETPEELREDLEAMKEEKELSEQLKGPGPLCNTSGNIFWNFNFWAWQACSCRISWIFYVGATNCTFNIVFWLS